MPRCWIGAAGARPRRPPADDRLPPQTARSRRHRGARAADWKDDDYVVLDGEVRIGRVYQEKLPAGDKWCWFIQIMGAPLPNRGIADSLDEAQAEFDQAYQRYRAMVG
jgi:hypothetical protein